MDKGREVKKVREKTVKNRLFEQQKRARKSSGTNCYHEEYTARISRIKDGLQVGEELAMGDEVFFVYCSMMMIIMVILWVR